MSYPSEIFQISENLFQVSKKIEKRELLKLQEVSENIGKSWSGSWLGYHSRVYYKDFQSPPPGARFSKEWGFMDTFSFKDTVGDWIEYDFDTVVKKIYQMAGNPDIKQYDLVVGNAKNSFEDSKSKLLSILSIITEGREKDKFLADLTKDIKEKKIIPMSDFVEFFKPSGQQVSRDMNAIQSGFHVPPHISVIAQVNAVLSPFDSCEELGKLAKDVVLHIENLEKKRKIENKSNTNVPVDRKGLRVRDDVITEESIKKLTFRQLITRLSIGAWLWVLGIIIAVFIIGLKIGLNFEEIKNLFSK